MEEPVGNKRFGAGCGRSPGLSRRAAGSRKYPDAEHFLRLRLKGMRGKDSGDGLGARVTATLPGGRVLVRESGYASGYLATGSPIVHLGLGSATGIEKLVVRWPSGFVQDLGAVTSIDRTVTVDESKGSL